MALADRLNAVVSLFHKKTLRYKSKLGTRDFNVFLWPHSERYWRRSSEENRFITQSLNSLRFSLPIVPNFLADENDSLVSFKN